jgi:Zn-dependent protease
MVILIAFRLLSAGTSGLSVFDALVGSAILFGLVLLHEFGHCFGARAVGGNAEQIIMWPLGGLASVDTPRRPWPSFVATAAGPAVNLIVCLVTGAFLYVWSHYQFFPSLNPLLPFAASKQLYADPSFREFAASPVTHYVMWIFSTSWMLLLFNLLPIYPMDGGRMLQEILWAFIGYVKALSIACAVGLIGSALMAMVGMTQNSMLLVFLAVSNVMVCVQMLMMLRAGALDEPDEVDYSASLRNEPAGRVKKRKKRWFRAARKIASREQAEQAKIDAILDKVKEKGLHSLTWWEKRTLRKATERQRQHDLAERR